MHILRGCSMMNLRGRGLWIMGRKLTENNDTENSRRVKRKGLDILPPGSYNYISGFDKMRCRASLRPENKDLFPIGDLLGAP